MSKINIVLTIRSTIVFFFISLSVGITITPYQEPYEKNYYAYELGARDDGSRSDLFESL
jgi:hypothetical protein